MAPVGMNEQPAWERAQRLLGSSPPNAQLVVRREFLGADIAGRAFNARYSFVSYTAALETTTALLTPEEAGPVRLLFCSDGLWWREDDLEDFADRYRNGRFRADDWSRMAVLQNMAEKSITFAGTISGFCYLERQHDEVAARRFALDVRGPAFAA